MELKNYEFGKCPFCGCEELDYTGNDIDGDFMIVPINCDNCHKSWVETYLIKFDGAYVDEK